jgi:hypothetical protein
VPVTHFLHSTTAPSAQKRRKEEEERKEEHTGQEQYRCSLYLQDSERVCRVVNHFFIKETTKGHIKR